MTNPSLGQNTYREIMSQGAVWMRSLENATDQVKPILNWLKKDHDEVIFTGCGSTHYLALAAAKNWIALTGQAACGQPASELWFYPSTSYSHHKPFLIAVSRSGETTETLHALQIYQERYGQDWLSISCYPESSMVKRSPLNLLATGAQEDSIAQTRSFSSMFLLTQLLAGTVAENSSYLDELNRVPHRFVPLVARYEELAKEIGSDKKYQHFVFLGSGLNYGLASEIMLKMKEMSTSISEVFHFMEFRHGPMSMITDRSLVIGLMSDNRKVEEIRVLKDMQGLGATTLALAETADGVCADFVVELESGVSEQARGALFLPFLQLLSFYHSLDKGLNPDKPTNLEAVVHL